MSDTTKRLAEIHAAHRELSSSLYVPDALELALAAVTSLPISDFTKTALIWLLVISNPSGGKTDTVEGFRGSSQVVFVDTFTENAFLTGYIEERTGKAPRSLLDDVNGKAMIIKDLSTLFSGRSEKVRAILGQLTSIYDGWFAKATGTRELLQHESKFSLVGCITPLVYEKHQQYINMLGSRFLTYRLGPLTDAERAAGLGMAFSIGNRADVIKRRNQLMREHVGSLHATPFPGRFKETQAQQEKIKKLAHLLSRGRTVVQYEKHNNEITFVQTEEPFRAVHQLHNHCHALVRIHGRKKVTNHELELLRRVVLSSMEAPRAKILSLFRKRPDGTRPYPDGLTRSDCETALKRRQTATERILDELTEAKLLDVERGGPGQEFRYHPVSEFADLIEGPFEPLDHIGDLMGTPT